MRATVASVTREGRKKMIHVYHSRWGKEGMVRSTSVAGRGIAIDNSVRMDVCAFVFVYEIYIYLVKGSNCISHIRTVCYNPVAVCVFVCDRRTYNG